MTPSRDMAAVITDLRTRAVAHNRAHPRAPVKLGRLKKLWFAGYRTGQERGADAAVNEHLRKLTTLSREVLAKAEGEFNESDHPRDQRGRFSGKGGARGGQRAFYRDVAEPEQHRQLVEENAGYRAEQTQVIPETRGTTFGPWGGGAAGLATGAVMGARADKVPGRLNRWLNQGVSWGVGRLGGAAGAGTIYAGGAVRNLARRARGLPAADMEDMATRAGAATARVTQRGARATLDAIDRVLVTPSRWAINSAKADIQKKGLTGVSRSLRMGSGRMRGALLGMALPGYLLADLGWRAGGTLGPMYDAAFPRHVQKGVTLQDLRKVAARPESVEMLEKAAFGMKPINLRGFVGARGAARAKIADIRRGVTQIGRIFRRKPPTPTEARARTLKEEVGALFPRPDYRSVGVGAGMGALGGGLMAGAGALGFRTYYRDENGRFTSKDKAVVGGSAALGALAGAAGVAGFLRGKNRALSREMAARIGALPAVVTPAGTTAGKEMTLDAAREGIRRGTSKAAEVGFRADPPDTDKAARTASGMLDDIQKQWGARARAAAEKSLAKELEAEKGILAARAAIIRNAAGDADTWVEHQVNQALRNRLKALSGDSAFRAAENGGMTLAHTHPAVKAMKGEPFMDVVKGNRTTARGKTVRSNTPKLVDRQGDLIEAARTGGGNGKDLFDSMPKKHKAVIQHEVAKADKALADWRAAKAQHAADLSAAQTQSRVERDTLDRLTRELNDKKAAGIPEADLAHLKDAIHTQAAVASKADTAAATLAIKPPKITDPFGVARIAHDAPLSATLETYIKNDAKDFSAVTAKLDDVEQKARAEVVEAVSALTSHYERAGSSLPSRLANTVIGRAGNAARKLGGQIKTIGGDLKGVGEAAIGDRPTRLKEWSKQRATQLSNLLLGEVGKDGKRDGGLVGAWNQLSPNMRTALAYGGGPLAALGIIGVAADNTITWNAKTPQEAWRHLRDPKTKPRWVVRHYDVGQNNQSMVILLEGRTKDGQRVVVQGKRIYTQEGRKDEDIPTLMPVQTYLDSIRNQGGQRSSAAQVSGDVAKRARDALESLRKTEKDAAANFQRVGGEDDEDSWTARHPNTNNDQKVKDAANAYLGDILRGFAGGVSPDKIHGSLSDIFDTPESDILTHEQERSALMGRSHKDNNGNEKYQRGLFNNKAVYDAYRGNDPQKLHDALASELRNIITKAKPGEGEEANLRRIVSLYSRGSGLKLTSAQQDSLRGIIRGGAGASAGEASASGASPGASPGAGTGGPRFKGPAPWNVSAHQEIHDTFLSSATDLILSRAGEGGGGAREQQVRDLVLAQWKDHAQEYADEIRGKKTVTPEEFWNTVTVRTVNRFKDPLTRSFSATDLRKVAARADSREVLAKSASALVGAAQRMGGERYEETKHARQPRGSDKGGEFAPKGGARGGSGAARPRPGNPKPAPQDNRGFFEPVRLGGAVGGAVGGSAAWEVASRFLPGPLKNAGMVGRLAYQLAAATGGSVAGQMAGERAGAATYEARGKTAPGSFMPERPAGEEASRTLGALGGSFLSALSRNPLKSIALGTAGQLSAEEAAAKVYEVTSRRYGPEVAQRLSRAAMPRGPAAAAAP